MRQLLALALALMCGVAIGLVTGYLLANYQADGGKLITPFVAEEKLPEKPLQQYAINELAKRQYQTSPIVITKELIKADQTDEYRELEFEYTTLGRKMTGQLTLPPASEAIPNKVIIAVRGYVPQETYSSGVGTSPAARVFAKNGYAVLAPDFFGFGESDPEPENSWEARLIKPINVIELIRSVEKYGVSDSRTDLPQVSQVKIEPIDPKMIAIWAHSNGGQIALTTLEILSEPIPTTLWAPVTAPFPYSVLYYSDEASDEGKEQRAWVAQFEDLYDVFDFSLTQHLDRLTGPIQIHHGTADEAAPKIWSDEFVAKLEAENERREKSPTPSTPPSILDPISYTYLTYPGADHNLRPVADWNLAVRRDLEFFKKELEKE